MIKIDIVSGFLGAGKTTLIKKLLKEALNDSKVVLIENEFGEIGIDGGFLREAGIEIREMNSGCICCSLVGDFGASLKEVIATYAPHRILIEPSGVGKLSDVRQAVLNVADEPKAMVGQDITDEENADIVSPSLVKKSSAVILNSAVAVVDATKCRMYIKNFGEFFIDQISHAETIILSRTDKISADKLLKCVELLRGYNQEAVIITTPWEQLEGRDILATMEKTQDLQEEMLAEMEQERQHSGTHHTHEHEQHSGHKGHHENCACGCHTHGHEQHPEHESHGENCPCGCHHHDHHHADEIFNTFGLETPMIYEKKEIEEILTQLEEESTYGMVLRAKGMVPSGDNSWLYFDYVPGESNIRSGKAEVTGKICVIGVGLEEENLKALWRKEGEA